jgi:hypothetical protein
MCNTVPDLQSRKKWKAKISQWQFHRAILAETVEENENISQNNSRQH